MSRRFSWLKRANSFGHAGRGIGKFIASEHNAWLHLAATMAVIAAGCLLKVSSGEAVGLAVAIGMVWVTEMLNTCLEKLIDFVSLERSDDLKFIKDVAAGAVLMASVTALAIGSFIFIPKLI
ncbi:MAG TPA: diacylglycerol kinase family protein [Puia sp.]|nr:diacylglycerol kinase family protein [Puia sp.]